MTYKPNSHYMDIIMSLARQHGISPQRAIEMMINEYIKDDNKYEDISNYNIDR
jgi:hypothetical protein